MTPRFLVSGIAAALVLAFSGELNSESVNLTTYYPAPSGVYTQMLTTGKAFFARNTNTGVAVGWGTTSFPVVPADPEGSSLKLSVAGTVAIGPPNGTFTNASLSAKVDPEPNYKNPYDLLVQGRVGVGTTAVDGTDADADNRGNGIAMRGRLRVGMGIGATDATRGRSYVYIDNSEGPCDNWPNGTAYSSTGSGATAVCSAGKYATFAPGIYMEGWWYQNRGGQVVASWGAGAAQYTTKVWGMGNGGNPTWVELGKNDGNTRIHCCTK
ncbi:MAG: hypothetical protein HZB91_01735 [Elusimicrobia bacterium]|nr:hypothetical protein [Elusimicrobiota bacterium]